MSSSGPPRPHPAPDVTRQQLDELDELLQRMLALPVSPAEDGPSLADESSAVLAWPEVPPLAPPTGVTVFPAEANAPAAATTTIEDEPAVTPFAATGSPAVADEPPPGWLVPFVLANRAFDRGAGLFGPPGRWLSGRAGRNLLGGGGVLMLAASAALLLLDWFGWIW